MFARPSDSSALISHSLGGSLANLRTPDPSHKSGNRRIRSRRLDKLPQNHMSIPMLRLDRLQEPGQSEWLFRKYILKSWDL